MTTKIKKIKNCFITGTDTDIGKTYVSVGLLKALRQKNYTTLGIKPIAAGCELENGCWRNGDATALQASASIKLPYELINPFAFSPPIAPHIAATELNCNLNIETIAHALQPALNTKSDINIIEGTGGWLVPLNDRQKFSDLVIELRCAVVLVVGVKLGCLNHALLTVRAIQESKLIFLGWIANYIDPQMESNERTMNIQTLKNWLDVPCLGEIPFGAKAEEYVDIDLFLHRLSNTRIS